MKPFLCLGSKKTKACIHSERKLSERYTTWGNKIKSLSIYCHLYHRYIFKYITSCDGFANSTLEQTLNNPKPSSKDEVK